MELTRGTGLRLLCLLGSGGVVKGQRFEGLLELGSLSLKLSAFRFNISRYWKKLCFWGDVDCERFFIFKTYFIFYPNLL